MKTLEDSVCAKQTEFRVCIHGGRDAFSIQQYWLDWVNKGASLSEVFNSMRWCFLLFPHRQVPTLVSQSNLALDTDDETGRSLESYPFIYVIIDQCLAIFLNVFIIIT